MSAPLATPYALLLAALADSIKAQWAWPSPETGFAIWALQDAGCESLLPPIDAWPADDRLIHSPSLAAAGYALQCGLAAGQRASWLAGIDRLRGRDAFPSDRQSFAYRPLELLGVAAGVSENRATELGTWMSGVLARSRKEHVHNTWSKALQYAAERLLNVSGGRAPTLDECEQLDELCLLYWLQRRFGISVDVPSLSRAILERGALGTLDNADLQRAAIVLRSLREIVRETIASEVEQHWQTGREARDAEQLVTHLCRRFHLFAEQLRQRHDSRQALAIGDEYDVQDVLHALLRLHFDDVRAEEVTPSVGGKSGRMDFLLKRERLVVEAKMTRKNLDQKKVGDELIIDMRRYRSHPDVRTLVCLVYDPGGYCPTPAALENDLTLTEESLRTIVVVCPKGL